MNAGSMFSGPSVPDGAEVGAHRALGVRSDQDQAAGRRRTVGAASTSNSTPEARMSWAKTSPSWSALDGADERRPCRRSWRRRPRCWPPNRPRSRRRPPWPRTAVRPHRSRRDASPPSRAPPPRERRPPPWRWRRRWRCRQQRHPGRARSFSSATAGPLGSGLGQRSLTLVTDDPAYRLPRTVVPSHYRLTLGPTSRPPPSRGPSPSRSPCNEPVTRSC